MKNFRFILSAVASLACLISLSSCVVTDTLEPEEPAEETKRVVLNLSAPSEVNTRASSDYKLRFIVKVFEATKVTDLGSYVDRKELLLGDKGNGGVENQLVFNVAPGNNYAFLLFADYIPADSQVDDKGLYPDFYYNTAITTNTKDRITLRTTPGKDSFDISKDFFNNEMYDCFGTTFVIKKTEDKVIHDAVLKRMVAKIRVLDNSDKTGDHIVSISKLKLNHQFNQSVDYNNPQEYSAKINIDYSPTSADDVKELFYYYTFAEEKLGVNPLTLSFNVEDNNQNTQAVEATNILVQRNYITTLKGKFLPEEPEDDPQETPDESDNNKGPIYVNMSTDENWTGTIDGWGSN